MGLWRYERQEALLHPFHRKQRRTGIHGVSAITTDCYPIQTGCAPGLHPETIRIGRDELDQDLLGRPTDRVRLPGGGRPRVEKKIPPS